jgi:hypothetical protein
MSSASGAVPTVVACVRWVEGRYHVRPVAQGTAKGPAADVVADPSTSGDRADHAPTWPLMMRLRGCAQRPPLDDAAVMINARADTFFIQPVLSAAQCAEAVAEMDSIAARVGWFDDGTGVKFQTNLPGNDVDGELFSARVRAHVESAIVDKALPLARTLFGGGKTLRVRGNSAALIRYGHAALGDADCGQSAPGPKDGVGGDSLLDQDEVVRQDELVTTAKVDAEWRLVEAQAPRLEVHRDGATGVTINVLLSQPTDFTSGGTYFEGAENTEGLVVRPAAGHALMHHRAMRHAAYPISQGLRHVLVVFLESTS